MRVINIYYTYANETSDAVSESVRLLAKRLNHGDNEVRVHGTQSLKCSRFSRIQSLKRIREQSKFLFKATMILFSSRRGNCINITLDSPSGLHGIAAVISKLPGSRSISIAWVLDLYRIASPPQQRNFVRRIQRNIEISSLAICENITTIGTCMQAVVKDLTGRESKFIRVLQDGNALYPLKHTRDPETFVIGYRGHAGVMHPLDLLANIPLAIDVRPIEVRIAGSGKGVERIRKDESNSVNVPVLFSELVPRDRINESMNALSVHIAVLSELAVGTCVPSKTYAAMAVGRPIIFVGPASSQAAIDVIQSQCGFVIENGDQNSFNAVIAALARDPELCRELGRAGRLAFDRLVADTVIASEWQSYLAEVGG